MLFSPVAPFCLAPDFGTRCWVKFTYNINDHFTLAIVFDRFDESEVTNSDCFRPPIVAQSRLALKRLLYR
jgi:hypothetical protein